ncbi:hypothetical protein H4R18_004475 [Coemansia javaensis]|uniref:SRR1-like domain-containing protein n=1 Tax=Coemansia javaensis TaxID=2761396 RepID=A0A9W8H5J6_9FUNG|nr:hypothetical protein H4R18_004475 [Coemansia javaensis]
MDADGFTVVARARGRRRHGGRAAQGRAKGPMGGLYPAARAPSAAELQAAEDRDVERHGRAVAERRGELARSAFGAELRARMAAALDGFRAEEIVCYGLGSLASSVSQWQAALVAALSESLGAPVLAFDPATTASDARVLRALGVAEIAENEQARRRAARPTLFFMPHCEQFLYENVVAANQPAAQLARIAIIGNPLGRYCEAPHIGRALPMARETRLPDEALLGQRTRPYAFSDTCITRFGAAEQRQWQ